MISLVEIFSLTYLSTYLLIYLSTYLLIFHSFLNVIAICPFCSSMLFTYVLFG
ncbi:hypothetical protein VCHA36O163_10834 [Vibrio chagasii]|nr:hypothetical protein VCHA36O163_10834 [Vibrio chagasii]